jgi:hypothetical protein
MPLVFCQQGIYIKRRGSNLNWTKWIVNIKIKSHFLTCIQQGDQYSSVGTVTMLHAVGRTTSIVIMLWFPPGTRDFSYLQCVQIGCYTISTKGTFNGDKETEAQRWPSRPSSAKVKNECSNIYTTPFAFMAFPSTIYSPSSNDSVHTSPDSFRKLVKSFMCPGTMLQECRVKMIISQLSMLNFNKIHHVMQELRKI